MFHGGMESLFSELKKLGGNMKLTVCKDVSHQVVYIYSDYSGDNEEKGWTTSSTGDRTNPEPDVWKWLFSQNLAERKVAAVQRNGKLDNISLIYVNIAVYWAVPYMRNWFSG